jgi:Flp pilus assembly protein TadG
MRGLHSRFRRTDDRGVSALELAIIAPSLLVLIFLVIQGALYFYGRSVALQAARDGVSQLRLYTSYDDCRSSASHVADNVVRFADAVGKGALTHATVTPACASVDAYFAGGRTAETGSAEVTVTVHGRSISLLGFSFPVTQSASGRVEQFQDFG